MVCFDELKGGRVVQGREWHLFQVGV